MSYRSLLFVPGDRPERFYKAAASGGDALILDLEDSVSVAMKVKACDAIVARLSERREGPALLVRINPGNSPFQANDLAALASVRLDGVMLPKVESPDEVARLSERLEAVKSCPSRPRRPPPYFRSVATARWQSIFSA